MKRTVLMAAVAGASLLSFSAPALAATPQAKVHHMGSCRASGDYAVCVTSGTANYPRTIRVHVAASPRQRVLVSWDMVCSKGLGAGSKSGQFHARTIVNRVLRHPYSRPDSCVVSADAQLSGGGRLHVWLTYTK